jgi:hypothetical protein
MRVKARLVRLSFILLWKNAVCGEIDNFELLLVDFRGFVVRYGRPLVKESGTSCIVIGMLTRSLRTVFSRAEVISVL